MARNLTWADIGAKDESKYVLEPITEGKISDKPSNLSLKRAPRSLLISTALFLGYGLFWFIYAGLIVVPFARGWWWGVMRWTMSWTGWAMLLGSVAAGLTALFLAFSISRHARWTGSITYAAIQLVLGVLGLPFFFPRYWRTDWPPVPITWIVLCLLVALIALIGLISKGARAWFVDHQLGT